jgi:hypothetical protein
MTASIAGQDVVSTMQFIKSSSKLNRRYISPGEEVNTGEYEVRQVFIRDARPHITDFSLDTTGFELVAHKSEVLLLIVPLRWVGHRLH